MHADNVVRDHVLVCGAFHENALDANYLFPEQVQRKLPLSVRQGQVTDVPNVRTQSRSINVPRVDPITPSPSYSTSEH